MTSEHHISAQIFTPRTNVCNNVVSNFGTYILTYTGINE